MGKRFEVASFSWSGVKTTKVSAWSETGCSVLLTTCNSGPTVSSKTWKIGRIFFFIKGGKKKEEEEEEKNQAKCIFWHLKIRYSENKQK